MIFNKVLKFQFHCFIEYTNLGLGHRTRAHRSTVQHANNTILVTADMHENLAEQSGLV